VLQAQRHSTASEVQGDVPVYPYLKAGRNSEKPMNLSMPFCLSKIPTAVKISE
jgi:hypothetical protein